MLPCLVELGPGGDGEVVLEAAYASLYLGHSGQQVRLVSVMPSRVIDTSTDVSSSMNRPAAVSTSTNKPLDVMLETWKASVSSPSVKRRYIRTLLEHRPCTARNGWRSHRSLCPDMRCGRRTRGSPERTQKSYRFRSRCAIAIPGASDGIRYYGEVGRDIDRCARRRVQHSAPRA